MVQICQQLEYLLDFPIFVLYIFMWDRRSHSVFPFIVYEMYFYVYTHKFSAIQVAEEKKTS